MTEKITVSIIKADVGGWPGHSLVNPELMTIARKELEKQKGKMLIDYYVAHCGDDLELIMTHRGGVDNEDVHRPRLGDL